MRTQRLLWPVFALFVVSTLGLVISLLAYVIIPEPHETVLGRYDSPRKVLQTRPGVEGPAVTQEGMIQVRGYRCIHSKQVVNNIEMVINYISADGSEPLKRVPDPNYPNSPRVEVPRLPGCFNETIVLTLPAAVGSGKWIVEAVEVNPMGGELRFWYSESFTVVGRVAHAVP